MIIDLIKVDFCYMMDETNINFEVSQGCQAPDGSRSLRAVPGGRAAGRITAIYSRPVPQTVQFSSAPSARIDDTHCVLRRRRRPSGRRVVAQFCSVFIVVCPNRSSSSVQTSLSCLVAFTLCICHQVQGVPLSHARDLSDDDDD